MLAIHRPTSIASSALTSDSPASSTTIASPSDISAKYSGELNDSANFASGGAISMSTITPTVPAMNDAIAAMPSAAPARPLARHLVAVEARHDRRRLAGHVEQDRGRRAAVLRAVVDAGEHDDARSSGPSGT